MNKLFREKVTGKVSDIVLSIVKNGINNEQSIKRIKKLREKFSTLPNDHLGQILIKRAVRITTAGGFVSGAGISGCEALIAVPVPEPAHKIAATSGTVGLIISDATITTKVQMQLVFDLSILYGCSYDKDDEEDVWQILKAALGLKGTEKVIGYGRVLFVNTAKKQFRALLRSGIRNGLQEKLVKIAGQQVAKVLAEKYVMRLIPIANMLIGATINNRVTNSVGRWARIKAKVRSSTFKSIDKLILLSRENAILALPILFYVSTADDRLTDNEAVLYAQTEKRLSLSETEASRVRFLIESDSMFTFLKEELLRVSNVEIKKYLFEIAITASAINLVVRDTHHVCLVDLSNVLELPYDQKVLSERIKYLKF